MQAHLRPFWTENDYWAIRNFLREVFLLNGRREHSWHSVRGTKEVSETWVKEF